MDTNKTTTRLDELVAERDARRAERDAATARLNAAEEAVLDERFRDWGLYQEGDIVLVPRKLFGERKMWPSKVVKVHRRVTEGAYRDGTPYMNLNASYTVAYRQADGGFSSGHLTSASHTTIELYEGDT